MNPQPLDGKVLLGEAVGCIVARALSPLVSALTTAASRGAGKSWRSFLDAKHICESKSLTINGHWWEFDVLGPRVRHMIEG